MAKRDIVTHRPAGPRSLRNPAFAGICEGAPVLTDRGLRPVEALRPGDRVLTSAGMQRLLRQRQFSRITRAVYVLAGTLGHGSHRRDSLLPAGQPVLLRDWRAMALRGKRHALIPVGELVDGEFLRDLGLMPMTFYHLHFERPGVIHADGLELACATRRPHVRRISFAPK